MSPVPETAASHLSNRARSARPSARQNPHHDAQTHTQRSASHFFHRDANRFLDAAFDDDAAFSDVDFSDVDFSDADFSDADFSDANTDAHSAFDDELNAPQSELSRGAALTIQVSEIVPDYLTGFGSLDAWREMARRRAFETLLEQIDPLHIFRTQCHVSEQWRRSQSGEGRDLIITCALEYWIENAR